MPRSDERTEFLKDIVICFAEDYGSNSWRQIKSGTYKPDEGNVTFIELGEGEDPDVEHDVTIETVARGILLLCSKQVSINSQMLANIKTGSDENDAGNIDAYDADMIVQAGVFGELIYG